MINFRYHIISIVAVFLALAIGVVMGSAVIDRVLVETLQEQHSAIDDRVDRVIADNNELRADLSGLEERSRQLADEGSQRLLAASLTDVPVLVLAVRGVESEGLDDLLRLLETAGANYGGTLWFTGRLSLGTDEERRDLARALGRSEGLSEAVLRQLAIETVAGALVPAPPGDDTGNPSPGGEPSPAGDPSPDGDLASAPGGGGAEGPTTGSGTISDLREAGFVDFEPPEEQSPETASLASPGTRVVLVSGPTAAVDNAVWARPLLEELVGEGAVPPAVPLLAVEAFAAGDPEQAEFTEPLRIDDLLSTRLSTVNNIDDFAGRLAAVLAIQDLAEGRVGHYGRGAPRLIPAPVE